MNDESMGAGIWIWMVSLVIVGACCCGCLDGNGAPKVVIEGDGGEKWVNSTQGMLVFLSTDDCCDDIVCDVELNDVVVWTMNVSSGVQAQCGMTLENGTNYIRVKATDCVGNSAWSDVYLVHVDVEGPQVVIVDFQVSP